jgi:hypothetical protein
MCTHSLQPIDVQSQSARADVVSTWKGGVGFPSVAMSCGAVQSASGYQFYRGSTRLASGSSRSFTNSGLSQGATYSNYRVRAYGHTPNGAVVYSGFSSEHDARTARQAITDSGTSSTIQIGPAQTGSWRGSPSNRYGERGDRLLQGQYFSTNFGYYRGHIDFGHHGVFNAVRNALGGGSTGLNRINNGGVVSGSAEVYLWKQPNVGTSGAIRIRWHRTNTASGSSPGLIGSHFEVWSPSGGSGGWVDIGNSHGTSIVQSKNRGLVMAYDSKASDRYGEFLGRSHSLSGDLRLRWTWSYQVQSGLDGVWIN